MNALLLRLCRNRSLVYSFVVVVVVLTLTRITKFVVTGPAQVTLECTPGKKQSKAKVVCVNIVAEASRTPGKRISKVKAEVSVFSWQTLAGTYVSRLAAETCHTVCHSGNQATHTRSLV